MYKPQRWLHSNEACHNASLPYENKVPLPIVGMVMAILYNSFYLSVSHSAVWL